MSTGLAYREFGDAKGLPLVLLHPIGAGADVWLPVVHCLSSFRLLLVDLPGYGASTCHGGDASMAEMARRVTLTLDAANIDRAVIVGVSLGAMVGQAMALDMPDRVRGLIMAHTTSTTSPAARQQWADRRELLRESGASTVIATTIERWFPGEFQKSAPLTVAWVARLLSRTSVEGWDCSMRAIIGLELEARLGEISAPTLIIRGTQDQTAPPEVAKAAAQRIPGACYVEIESGHIGCVEQPIGFAEAVGAFCGALLRP